MDLVKFRTVAIDQRALIEDPEGRILLVKESDHGWDLPGGKLAQGETWREGLEQLLAKQLAIEVMTKQPFFAADFQDPDSGEYIYMSIVACEVFGAQFSAQDYEDAVWVKPSEIKNYEFAAFDVGEAIREFIRTKV